MRGLSPADLLQVCDAGQGESATARGLLLLAAAEGVPETTGLAELPIGERDRRLLLLRESTFGGRADARCACPRCQEALDFQVDLAAIRQPPADSAGPFSVDVDGDVATFRLPNSTDLESIGDTDDVEQARRQLLDRCVIEVRYASRPDVHHVSETLAAKIAAAMSEADPQSDVQLAIQCPQCGHRWASLFDIVTFVWTELEIETMRLLREVHRLASCYGWRESDIVSMSAWRRRMYLELLDV